MNYLFILLIYFVIFKLKCELGLYLSKIWILFEFQILTTITTTIITNVQVITKVIKIYSVNPVGEIVQKVHPR